MTRWDAILIPGGGVRTMGVLPPWIRARFDRALELDRGEWMMPLSGGSVHRAPPLDEHGFPILEAAAGAQYLLSRGVDRHRILQESTSLDTIGNAYFARLLHCAPRGFRRLLVVTSSFHMVRTAAVFRWIFALPGPGQASELGFEASPDEGISTEMLAGRREKEQRSLAGVHDLCRRLSTLDEVHRWLFTEHGAYAAGHERKPDPASDPGLY